MAKAALFFFFFFFCIFVAHLCWGSTFMLQSRSTGRRTGRKYVRETTEFWSQIASLQPLKLFFGGHSSHWNSVPIESFFWGSPEGSLNELVQQAQGFLFCQPTRSAIIVNALLIKLWNLIGLYPTAVLSISILEKCTPWELVWKLQQGSTTTLILLTEGAHSLGREASGVDREEGDFCLASQTSGINHDDQRMTDFAVRSPLHPKKCTSWWKTY